MGAASFKSLYQKRPTQVRATANSCAGRSRYSTKTCRYRSASGESIADSAPIDVARPSRELLGMVVNQRVVGGILLEISRLVCWDQPSKQIPQRRSPPGRWFRNEEFLCSCEKRTLIQSDRV